MSLTRVWGMLGGSKTMALYTCFKAVSPRNQAKCLQQVHTGGEGEDSVWHRKRPVQGN